MTQPTIDPEVLVKTVVTVLKAGIDAAMLSVNAQWAAPQTVGLVTLPADDRPLGTIPAENIIGGQQTAYMEVDATQSFPAVYVYCEAERPLVMGEQPAIGMQSDLVIHCLVQGVTLEDAQYQVYRYLKAVLAILMTDRSLRGVANLDTVEVNYITAENDPLYKAGSIRVPSAGSYVWE